MMVNTRAMLMTVVMTMLDGVADDGDEDCDGRAQKPSGALKASKNPRSEAERGFKSVAKPPLGSRAGL